MGQRKLYLQYYLEYNHCLRRRILIAALLVCLVMYWHLINERKRKRSIACLGDSDSEDSDDSTDLNSDATYEDQVSGDSDTLSTHRSDANVENTSHTGAKKRPRGSKSPTKKPMRTKSRFAECIEDIRGTMESLRDTLAATAPPQMPHQTDPHASLWQRLEAMPLTPDQRVLIGEHLSTKDNKGKRGWLCNASDATLNAWVFKYLSEKEGLNL
ncbi:hypothetical protein BS78_01G228900 [Paspalum vaginatum]|nr:hypothetical protein BS78_01G228900 [Paspalum vaginatum]